MAYVLSHMHSLIRGSVGGVTYLANQFHQIVMRARTAPVQPNTPWQIGMRTAFDSAEALWEAISEAERDDWRFYALTCVYPGPAGDYTVPGRQLMIGSLALASYANALQPDEFLPSTAAPVISGWFNPGTIQTAVYGGEDQGVAVSIYIPAGRKAVAVVDVSIAFNLTRTRYKGPWISAAKSIVALPAAATTIISIDRPLGTIGQAIFTRTRIFTAETSPSVPIGHALAFPAILRHISEAGAGNGNDKPAKNSAASKKVTKKKLAKVAA